MNKKNIIFGIRAVIEAINSDVEIDKVFIQKESTGSLIKELLGILRKNNISFSYVPFQKLNQYTNNNHQGVVATISAIKFYVLEELIDQVLKKNDKSLFLILDGISDVRNFGAIIRTAECVGVNGIIISKNGSAPVNGDTIKTSAGAVFNIPICKVDHIKDAIFYLQSSDIYVVAATEKTQDTLYQTDFDKSIALVLGSEDKGINPSVLKIVDSKAKLPIFGTISSLNVSVACGAFLYEVVRQRNNFYNKVSKKEQ